MNIQTISRCHTLLLVIAPIRFKNGSSTVKFGKGKVRYGTGAESTVLDPAT